MANLDTAAKRRAATQFLPWMIQPDADGVIDDHDRAQAAGIYSGIAIGSPSIVVYASQIELFSRPLIDPATGKLCSGYTVNFYAAGTSSPKDIWTEPAMSNNYTSYTLDSGGRADLYGNGLYRIVVKNIDGAPVLILDGIKLLPY